MIDTRQRGVRTNFFSSPALMAVKKWTRNRFEYLKGRGYSKVSAAKQAVSDLYRMIPEFKQAWEEENRREWWGDEWFMGRIDHQSSSSDNKFSHMRLEEFLKQLEPRTYSWEEWKSEVNARVVESKLPQHWWVYVLPMTYPGQEGSRIQKVGVTTDLEGRLRYYLMTSKRNDAKRHTFGLLAARQFAFTYNLGKMYEYEAKAIESRCHVAVGNGSPSKFGVEWFEIGTEEAISRLKGVVGNGGKPVARRGGMIIQVRGTSGSGKSTVMRSVMNAAHWNAVKVDGRKQPLYYRSCEPGMSDTVVLGHYESPCGGCDTIGSAAAVAELTSKLRSEFPTAIILQEGLLLSEDSKWTANMPGVRVLFLTTPVERCIEQIKKRRTDAGNEKPLKEGNTRNRVAVIERARVKLESLGVYVRRCSANQAPQIILNWIRLHANREKGNGSGTELDHHANGR